MPGTGDRHPMIVLLHGFGNDKHEWESTSDVADGADKYHWNNHWFARHGYYVVTYTARGVPRQRSTCELPTGDSGWRGPDVPAAWRLGLPAHGHDTREEQRRRDP